MLTFIAGRCVCQAPASTTTASDAKTAQAKPATIASPDGKIAVEIQTDAEGQLTWSVQRQGKPFLGRPAGPDGGRQRSRSVRHARRAPQPHHR